MQQGHSNPSAKDLNHQTLTHLMVWVIVEYLPCIPWLRGNAPHHHSTAAFGAQDEGKAAHTPIGARRAPWWHHGVDQQGGGGLESEFGQRDRDREGKSKRRGNGGEQKNWVASLLICMPQTRLTRGSCALGHSQRHAALLPMCYGPKWHT